MLTNSYQNSMINFGVYMKISTKGTYSIRIMAEIAKTETDKLATVSYLSEKTNISEKYLEKIINKLLKSELLISFRGANGGYKLNKPASEITVKQILSATEGNMKSVSCIDEGKNCDMASKCLTINLWAGLTKVVDDYLKSITLEDVINKKIKVANITFNN